MQVFIHYFLHLGFPLVIAFIFFRSRWKQAYLLMLLTMLVDLDHLLADPIFQADRCSINYHPLHSYWAIAVYFGLLFFSWPYRPIGLGLVLHMITDFSDCIFTYKKCASCLENAPILDLIKWATNLLSI